MSSGEQQREKEKQTPHWAKSLIPGPWDHDLSRRQLLNQLSHPGAPIGVFPTEAPPSGAETHHHFGLLPAFLTFKTLKYGKHGFCFTLLSLGGLLSIHR